jgi:NAD(P)-dependent dehydrogenase (short-subunit alcohol dehydrogenase family)
MPTATLASPKVVLVTGTSRGIGKAIAEHLESKGLIVYGSHRAATTGKTLSIEITNMASCEAAIAEIVKREGRLDVLCNNAAYELVAAHEEATVEDVRNQFVRCRRAPAYSCLHAFTPFPCVPCHSPLPHRKRTSSGAIT